MLLQFNYNLTQLSRTTSSSSSSSTPSSSSASASASESAMNRKLLSSSKMLRRQRNGDSFSFLYYPLVLTVTLLLVLNPAQLTAAERDFNFNDSQVPLIEPKDEPQTHVEAVPLDSAAHQHETEHQHQHPHQHQHQHQHQHHHQPQHNSHQDPYAVELSHCRYGDNEIVLSLILKNYNWHDLNESRRAKVLEKLSKFFAIPKEFITMESVTKHDLYEMQKEALKKGNNKCHQNNRKLGRATFIIGCGTTYFSMGEPISKQITQQVKDGSLDNITGEKFGWWVIWKKHYKARAERNRRQIEGSGDDDADNDDDDYDYEYEDEETIDDPAAGIASNASPGRSPAQDADGTTLETEDNQEDVNKTSATPTSPLEDSSATTTIASTSAASAAAITTTSTSSEPETTTPAASPDYVEPKAENTPPMIKTRLQKFAVTSGKSFRYAIPSDTFHDNEDFSNLRLDLTDKDGNELKSNSWLQFNAESKEIYGLPLDDAVSKWQYRLTATDSGNESVAETVEISVQQHRGLRTVNHEINVAVKINEKNIHYIDWQMSLINAIATTLGDDNSNSIVVREIRQNPQDSALATLVFFNETLPTSECPEMQLNNLVKRLDAQRLSDLVQPTLGIKSITGQLIGSCQKLAATVKPKLPSIPVKNAPPVLLNQVDHIVATVGHLLVYKVPHDAFFDAENSALKLSLKTKEHKELSARHWLQFDAKNQEFYGVPKSGDAGSEEYNLVAEDAGGLSVSDALVVQVNHAPKKEFSIYVKAYLAVKHEHFNADLQRKFVERIAALFGDVSTQNLQIRSVTTNHDNGGTIVNFYNTTLFKSHNHCPEEEIEAVTSVYQMQERVKKALGPELELTNAQIVPFASCHAQTDTTHREFIPNKNDEPLLKSTFSDNYLYTIILPAVIIVSMIIIASLVACCLHRRRHKSGKMELGDEEERKSFRTKGIPVIFQDELDEKPEIGNKSPIILKDEKPPLLPPSYNTSNMNGDNDVDEYVPPPAVVVGGREARGKSPATPSYRKPPPYVSP